MTEQLMEHHKGYILLLTLGFTLVANAQDLLILTGPCDRAVGESILMQITYSPTDPADPLTWNNPIGNPVGACRPAISCQKPPGYNLTVIGKTYSITIENATATDEGLWEAFDTDFRSRTVNLDLIVHLPGVVVTCNSTSSINIADGSPQTVMCYTECLDPNFTNATLDFVLKNTSVTSVVATSPITCTPPMFSSSKSITLDTSKQMTGNQSLCYKLTSGQCMYDQPSTECITVVFPDESTTTPNQTTDLTVTNTDVVSTVVSSTPNYVNGTFSTIDLECASRTGLIVVIAFGGTLVIICVGILIGFVVFVMKQENGKEQNSERDSDSKRKSHRKKGKCVAALLVAALICFILVVCLIGYALGSNTGECEPFLYAGIALLIIGIIILIVAAVIYVKCFRGSIEETRNDTNLKKIKNSTPPEG